MAEKSDGVSGGGDGGEQHSAVGGDVGSSRRMERRKAAKKEKRRQKRKEVAAKEREEEEARLNDPEEQQRVQLEEERERERVERERKAFDEHERVFLEALAAKRKAEEEDGRRKKIQEDEFKQNQVGHKDENSDDDWEYTEEGPPEIIWQGNEIIVKKKKVRVKRKDTVQIKEEDPNRPTSNPLPPQSEAFADYRNRFVASAQQFLDNVAQQTPNFGTEQDKAHCPFHLKTGACRFGSHCSRVHFYPDKSCTLLIKNMYTGPGISWEQDEGLETFTSRFTLEVHCFSLGWIGDKGNVYTDEEVERSFEEFYEDVHTEFLKFGEIINFKVCKNGSSHLRGNVYIHYKSLDSALVAYQSVNGRYFAGKLVTCEFIGVTKWKLAICGEYMKSRHKTCNRGTACNFIHCFRNPGGDYEWADKDGPPPDYWVKKMAALFGHSEEYGYDNRAERKGRNSSKMRTADPDSSYRRSRSRDSSRSRYEEYDSCSIRHFNRHNSGSRRAIEVPDKKNHGKMNTKSSRESKNRRTHDSDSEGDRPFMDGGEDRHQSNRRKNTRNWIEVLETQDFQADRDGRDQHRISTRDSSKHHNKVLSPDESKEKRDRNHGNDCREEDKSRYHRQMRKWSRDSSEGVGFIDEYAISARKLKDEASREESGFEKVEPLEVKKRHRSSREDHSSMEPSENNASGEGLKSDGYYETIISGHGERTKLCDIADMNVVGYQKLRERCSLRHQTSSRDSSSDESSYKTRSSRMYSPRSESHDSAYHSKEDLDKQSCWESDKSGLQKHCESERTSSGDLDRYTGNSNLKDPDSDECCRGRRPRGSGWSSGQKSSDGSEEVDSAEECGEHKDKQEKHRRKHRTRSCKQRRKKTN